jgi:hypothetical protein
VLLVKDLSVCASGFSIVPSQVERRSIRTLFAEVTFPAKLAE